VSTALAGLALTFRKSVACWVAHHIYGPGVLFAAGAHLDVQGLEYMPDDDRPLIFMANHTSLIDTPLMITAIPRPIRFIVKQEVAYVPFIGWYAWGIGMIFVDRKNHSRAMEQMRRAVELTRERAPLMVFPEGTRSKDGYIQPFKKGGFVLAIETGARIVPIGVAGAGEVAPPGGFRVRPGTISVRLGPPIDAKDYTLADRDRLIDDVRTSIVALSTAVGGKGAATVLPAA